jgi:hypothetical protein
LQDATAALAHQKRRAVIGSFNPPPSFKPNAVSPVYHLLGICSKRQRSGMEAKGSKDMVHLSGITNTLILTNARLCLRSEVMKGTLTVQAVFLLGTTEAELPAAMATATATPAEAVGLTDRGCLDIGKRADLIRARLHRRQDEPPLPIVQSVWRAGRRVA